MHRMTGFDALFIYDESPTEPQHTIKVAVLGREASRSYSFDVAKEGVRARLAHLPPLRWKALRVPFDLHHPVWIEGGEPDLDYHVRRLAIPSPGGRRELCEVISFIASVPLDPSKPLWEIWFLEGYEGDKIVSVLKINHALADGESTRDLLERALTGEPMQREDFLSGTIPPAEPVPSRRKLLLHALCDLRRDLLDEMPRLFRTAREVRRRRRAARPARKGLNPLGGPRHAFGGPLSRHRSFSFVTVPLDDARHIKSVHGVTINDVLLATVAGAVRRYLDEHEGIPGKPILGSIAGSIRTEEQRGTFGNRVTTRFLWLPTHIEDPVQRLIAAHEGAALAKQDIQECSNAHIENWIAILPPFAVKLFSRAVRAMVRVTGVSGGVVVSNVAGPRKQLYAAQSPIENFISVGHMKYVAGLNVTVWSYTDKLNFALYACREAVPDLGRISECIEDSFHELLHASESHGARAA